MSRLLAWLCAPVRPVLAPLLRVAVVGWMLVERVPGSSERMAKLLRDRPMSLLDVAHIEGVFRGLSSWPPPRAFVDHVELALWVTGLLAMVGLSTRLALLVFGALLTVVLGIQSGYGFFNHTVALPTQIVLALAVLPGTTAWSVDGLLWQRWQRFRRRPTTAPTTTMTTTTLMMVPRFGDVLLLALVGVIYAAAGVAKLRMGAMGWLNGETLGFYLSNRAATQYWLRDPVSGVFVAHSYMSAPSALALWMSRSPLVCLLSSWAALVVELVAPVCLLLGGRARVLWCASAVGFHVGVIVLMGIPFAAWMWIDVLVAVPVVVGWWRRRRQRQQLS